MGTRRDVDEKATWFNGYLRPLIVLLTIPLTIVGVGIGLQVMKADFSFVVILGIFALAGIIVNNGIVLIDRIDIERQSGQMDDWEAVINACICRLRPISITTITTIVGLLPLILGRDVLFYGMASILAFGLAIGTVLTLGFVPALYCIFFGIKPPGKEKKSAKKGAAVAIAAASLSSCSPVGPDYTPPDKEKGEFSSIATGSPNLITQGEKIDPKWWHRFGDSRLNALINRALKANTDVRASTARLAQVKAQRRGIRSGLFPTVNAEASSSETRSSGAGLVQPGAPLQNSSHSAGFNASWEPDFFGRIKRSIESADAEVGATESDRRGILVLVIAETSSSYFELRSLQRQLEIIEINEGIANKSLELTKLLVSRNLGAEFDVLRARAELSDTKAQKTDVMAAMRITAGRIAVLTGQQPAKVVDELVRSSEKLPKLKAIPIGVPSDLVARRPDVRAAERRLAAASADIGVKIADYFPRFSLTGGIETSALSVDDLFSSASEAWSFRNVVQWPVLDFGRRKAAVEASRAKLRSALAEYDSAVLSAFEDVERALATYVYSVKKAEELSKSVDDREKTLKLAQLRFDSGLDDFFQVLDSQRRLATARNSLAPSRASVFESHVRVFQSFGGGGE